jgi:ABC-type ATPase involved in cell division
VACRDAGSSIFPILMNWKRRRYETDPVENGYSDGQDVTDFTEDQFAEIRRKVTMVFQSGALFDSLTVADNIAFPMGSRA